MVTIEQLQVKYGDEIALSINHPITFGDGERIGIIGSNGAGKSTLVKSILGLTKYKGRILSDLTPQQMAVHMQQNAYVDTMSIKYIMEAVLNTSIKRNKQLQDLIQFFQFESCLNKKYSTLSGGQKQRLTIIMVLIQDAPLVFFDEVTSGLDFETRQQLMEKIVEWYEGKNTTICMVSHYYEELEHLVDKLLILDHGHVVDYGSKEELFQKYCGRAVILLSNTKEHETVMKAYKRIHAPNYLLAYACQSEEEEMEMVKELLHHNISYKRSTEDIEIMSINAKECGHYEEDQ